MSNPADLRPLSAGADRYLQIRRVTIVGALVNACIAFVKLLFGVIGHSQALVADGLHSVSDLASDFLLLFAAKHASRGPDSEHPYGHGRIETLFSVVQGLILGAFAVSIGVDAVRRLFDPQQLLRPEVSTLFIAVLAVFTKEALYQYTVRAARRLRSSMLRGNAWDHRSDAISSVVVVLGVAGTLAGLPYLDAVAAVGVALTIVKISFELIWQSMRELIDTALDAERVDAIRGTILAVSGVRACHMLRTRRMGGDALVDVHILVDPELSVSEGHQISEQVRTRLIDAFEEINDVMVHIDPEDDERSAPSGALPGREELLQRLYAQWREMQAAQQIQSVNLHYLDGKVHVELLLPLSAAGSLERAREISASLAAAGRAVEEVAEIKVLFH